MDAYTNCALLFSHPIVEANGAAILPLRVESSQKWLPSLLNSFIHSSLLHYIPTSASHRDLSCPKQNGWSVENTHNLTGHPIYLCQPKGKIAAAFGCPSVGVSLTLVAETKISSIQLLPRKTKVP
jgi:hypothetical protein